MPRVKTRTVVFLFAISFASFALFAVWDVRRSRSNEIASSKQHLSAKFVAIRVRTSQQDETKVPATSATHLNQSLLSFLRERNVNPWFMRGGTLRPDNRLYPFHSLPIWPDQVHDDDRILNQLMYVPADYPRSKPKTLKRILLYFGRGGWNARDLPMGQKKFLECPVNTCELSIDANDAESADLIFFKVSSRLRKKR